MLDITKYMGISHYTAVPKVLRCKGCGTPLKGKQKTWCSTKCHSAYYRSELVKDPVKIEHRKYLARLRSKKKKESKGLICKECGGLLGIRKRSFCSFECKVKFHIKISVAKQRALGFPMTPELRDYKNEGRKRRRREKYLNAQHKCKCCNTLLTLDHYPKTKFCSDICNAKFHSSPKIKAVYIKGIEERKEVQENEVKAIRAGMENKIPFTFKNNFGKEMTLYISPNKSEAEKAEIRRKYTDRPLY